MRKLYSVLIIFFYVLTVTAQHVGVGTNTPQFKLDVRNGSINTDSVYRIGTLPVLSVAGTQNLFAGQESGIGITTGSQNTFAGYRSGMVSSSGSYNSFFGYNTGSQNTTGDNNSFFGASAGRSTTTGVGNAFLGSGAGLFNTEGSYNSFTGPNSGYYNTTGSYNAFYGFASGSNNTTGSNNSFMGGRAGIGNTGGYSNVAVGYASLYNNANGSNLVAVGDSALYSNSGGAILGAGNTGIGSKAMYSNTTGFYSVAAGYRALYANVGGSSNTAIGFSALGVNVNGNQNTAVGNQALFSSLGNGNIGIGYLAGLTNTTGNENILIGSGCNVGSGGLTNATAIGSRALVDQSNSMVLGSINGTNGATASTSVGIGLTAPSASLHIRSNSVIGTPQLLIEESASDYARITLQNTTVANRFWTIAGLPDAANANAQLNFYYNNLGNVLTLFGNGNATLQGTLTQLSDARLKTNIIPLINALSAIEQLNAYRYQWKDGQKDQTVQLGLLAQEVTKVFPELTRKDEQGLYSVNYNGLVPVLIAAIKEQQIQIAELQKKADAIEALQESVELLKEEIRRLQNK